MTSSTSTIPATSVHSCTDFVGPNVPLSTNLLELFHVLFPLSLIITICEQTNLYAKQVLSPDAYDKYTEITPTELHAYFGFMILMGINQLPSIYDYWKRDTTYYQPVAGRIARNRFREICRFLHFVDNSSYTVRNGDPQYDKVWKVRPVIDIIVDRFLNVYTPHHQNSIDEAMIPFKGRSSVKQYMPMKPIKRGVKVWTRADSINGYVCELQIYLGKVGNTAEKQLGARVVKDLTRALVGKYYTIYCDNFFTSAKLFEDLYSDGVYACGTLRSDRVGYPEEFKHHMKRKKLGDRGTNFQIRKGNLLFSLWQDNKLVNVVSSNCDSGEGSVQRTQKDNTRLTVKCPHNIIEYNKYMGGVDKCDQMRQYYCVRQKTRKFYRYIFWFLFELTLHNAFILSQYVPSTGRNCHNSFVDFRIELAKQLIGDYNSRKRRGRPSINSNPSTFSLDHFPLKEAKRSKCYQCYHTKKIQKWTSWKCQTCHKYLCHTGITATDCFIKYHK